MYRQQACPAPNKARLCHRMIMLEASASSGRPTRISEIKIAIVMIGDARSFRSEINERIERQMRIIAEGTALAYNVEVDVHYTREFVPLLNDPALADEAMSVALGLLGEENVRVATKPMTGSEDFAQFLTQVPSCFVFLGNGKDSAPLHNPGYYSNDDGLGHGMQFHAGMARRRLSKT